MSSVTRSRWNLKDFQWFFSVLKTKQIFSYALIAYYLLFLQVSLILYTFAVPCADLTFKLKSCVTSAPTFPSKYRYFFSMERFDLVCWIWKFKCLLKCLLFSMRKFQIFRKKVYVFFMWIFILNENVENLILYFRHKYKSEIILIPAFTTVWLIDRFLVEYLQQSPCPTKTRIINTYLHELFIRPAIYKYNKRNLLLAYQSYKTRFA